MVTLLQDTRYALRHLSKAPGFAIVAVLTLALGIGANTALFTLGNSILLRPRPGVRDAEQLVWIAPISLYSGRARSTSYPDYRAYRDQLADIFSAVTAIDDVWFSVGGGEEPVRVRGQFVAANFFETLGAPIQLGRGFTDDDERAPGVSPVAVMSHHFWEHRFERDPSIVGRQVVVNGQRLTVVGVAGRGFNGPDHDDSWRALWIPLAMMPRLQPNVGDEWLTSTNVAFLRVLGRLRPGVHRVRADAAVATITARLWQADSTNREAKTARTFSARAGLPPGSDPELVPVTVLAAAVTGVILLIACANVSNLLLGRAVVRRREMAVRLAIGASRARVVRQLLTESLVLGALGSGVALLVAIWGAHAIVTTMIPIPLELAPDPRVLAFSIGVAFFATALFGLIPALHATRADVAGGLKDGAAGSSARRARLQSGFVVAQVSLSLLLLVTAGLFLRSLQKAQAIDVGFDATQRVLALSFDLRMQGYDDERSDSFAREAVTRAASLPGVESAALASQVPMSGRLVVTEIALERDRRLPAAARDPANRLTALQTSITPGYFRTLQLPIVYGRDFDARDGSGAPRVAIVSDQLARRLWPREDPIGQRLSITGADGRYLTVVGVAREALVAGIRERSSSTVYIPRAQGREIADLTLLVRASGDASQLASALRAELRSLDPNLPVYGVQTLAQYRREHMAESRHGSTLLGIFGGLALLLASIGVYGVLAFAVSQRTREIGVRIALGARQSEVVSLFIREGMRRTMLGVAIGLVLSFGVARLLASVFLGVTAGDAVAFGAVAALLVIVATAACWIPARRAAAVDPVRALRHE